MEYFGENPAGLTLIAKIAVHSTLWRSGARINGEFRRFPPFPAAVEKFGENVKSTPDVEYPRGFVEKSKGGKAENTVNTGEPPARVPPVKTSRRDVLTPSPALFHTVDVSRPAGRDAGRRPAPPLSFL